MINRLIYFLVGEKTRGEKLNDPKVKTVMPEKMLSFNDWCKYSNFSKQYYPKPKGINT